MNPLIHESLDELRRETSENALHSLIEFGEAAIPAVLMAWRSETDFSVRLRFLEVLSEIPAKETLPIFEQLLRSQDETEVRLAALALLRFDPLRYEAQVGTAIQSHPTLSIERDFTEYIFRILSHARQQLRETE